MKESHYLSKNVFWENAVGYLLKQWMLELSNLCHCMFSTPYNLLVEISGAPRMNESNFLSKNVFWDKCCWVSQKWWKLELSNHCHFVQTSPWKLTSRDFWSPRNMKGTHFLSKNVFWKNAGDVAQKRWMLELSNLYHCVQHPWKLTSRDFWSSRNKMNPLSKQKCVLRKCCGVSQIWHEC